MNLWLKKKLFKTFGSTFKYPEIWDKIMNLLMERSRFVYFYLPPDLDPNPLDEGDSLDSFGLSDELLSRPRLITSSNARPSW